MYAHKRLRPAKLSVKNGEPIEVLVALTQEFNTLDSRRRIVGWLQSRSWLKDPGDTKIFDLSLEDGRKLEIFVTRESRSILIGQDSDDLFEAEFIDAKSMKDLNNGN